MIFHVFKSGSSTEGDHVAGGAGDAEGDAKECAEDTEANRVFKSGEVSGEFTKALAGEFKEEGSGEAGEAPEDDAVFESFVEAFSIASFNTAPSPSPTFSKSDGAADAEPT